MKFILSKLINLGGQALCKFAYKNYYSAKFFYKLRLFLGSFRKSDALIIYQMGKVGSSTITRSLQNCELHMPILSIHSLLPDNLIKSERVFREEYPRAKIQPLVLWNSQYLRNQLYRGLRGQKWKILTLVRDPIARNLSLFFQWPNMKIQKANGLYKIKSPYFNYEMDIKVEGREIKTEDIEKLKGLFFEKVDHDRPLVYFDKELKAFLGIDVFSSEFPKLKGYGIYKSEFVDVLLIRLEDLNRVTQQAIKDFLGIKALTLVDSNIGSNKDYSQFYQRFLNAITFPDSYIHKMYTSRYVQHFYSEEEINSFKRRWEKKNIV